MAVLYSSTVFCSWLIMLADGTWTGVLLRATVSASGRCRLLPYSALSSTLELPRLAEVLGLGPVAHHCVCLGEVSSAAVQRAFLNAGTSAAGRGDERRRAGASRVR